MLPMGLQGRGWRRDAASHGLVATSCGLIWRVSCERDPGPAWVSIDRSKKGLFSCFYGSGTGLALALATSPTGNPIIKTGARCPAQPLSLFCPWWRHESCVADRWYHPEQVNRLILDVVQPH